MLDKESEIYHSGMLNVEAQRDHFVVAFTRDGIEVSAATRGLRFEYSDTWHDIREKWATADKKLKERKAERAVFIQRVPTRTDNVLEGN